MCNCKFKDTSVDSILSALPTHYPNMILCGDFNARLGDLTGDSVMNPRGRLLQQWTDTNQLAILNSSLSFGQPTWAGVRQNQATTSIIDLFITNLSLSSPSIAIDSDLSLSSDHNLMHLSFLYDFVPVSSGSDSASTVHPRRLWNLSRLNEDGPQDLYLHNFVTRAESLYLSILDLLQHPPSSRPDIDGICHQLNDVIYTSLDVSIGSRRPRPPAHDKKYWTPLLQQAADHRDKLYSRWRRASGIDKAEQYNLFQRAQQSFRTAVLCAKRQSFRAFCDLLDKDFVKATSTIEDQF
ncbi:unnamed protein product [Mucor hiemalis]